MKYFNFIRSLHHDTPPVSWDEDLAEWAQEESKRLLDEGKVRYKTTGGPPRDFHYLPSLGMKKSNRKVTCADALASWYVSIG